MRTTGGRHELKHYINESAKLLACGDYNASFSGHGFLEISELSDTLNTAAFELSKVEGLRRELMANISHDLRTPLALIYSYAEMMNDFPDEITSDQTQTIMDETKRLTSLVNDVLDVSRLETGNVVLHSRSYNLTSSLSTTVDRMTKLVKNDGFSIVFDYSDEFYVLADEVKITQAFYNLLLNAINYSSSNKYVVVSQSAMNGFVRISVEDFGDGISPESLPYIWDRYYKVDKNHKRAVTGSGLGLSIVKTVVVLHGGHYGVTSQIGKGSSFGFDVPMRDIWLLSIFILTVSTLIT